MASSTRQHPLEITMILDTLASHINLEDLATYRVVCKSWFLSSIKIWRANKTLVLKPDTPYPDEWDIDSLKFYKLDSFPYTKLVVDGQKISSRLPLARSYSFSKVLLSTMTHLTLKDIGAYFTIDRILYMICDLIPNVTDLVLVGHSWMEIGRNQRSILEGEEAANPIKNRLKRFTIVRSDARESVKVQLNIPWTFLFEHFPELELIVFIACPNPEGFYANANFGRVEIRLT